MNEKTCTVLGCDTPAAKRGWCMKHYTRYIRHGDPLGGGYGRGQAKKWLFRHVAWCDDDCLIWPFYRDPSGYARVSYEGRDQIAARVMCRLAHGEPESAALQCAHSCGNGASGCVNPMHLRWATPHENQMDKITHGTSNRGEKHPHAKLTENEVLAIRERLSKGETERPLAAEYQVSQGSISRIRRRLNWGWL